ncbi:MAG TPA: sterol desaturase family protein [Sandaracinaceae bacterium LLY-WYZ-13_1]|nr:sterol desaturase family protein [Sandaracinaceae bacterium LLY-WYZ-13_1]
MARRDPHRIHRWLDRAVLVGVALAGALHPAPLVWFQGFGATFVALLASIYGGAWVVTRWAEARTERIQGPRRKPPMLREEAWVTAQAMWVMAGLAAWPIAEARLGHPTGLSWSLEGTGWTPLTATLVSLLGVVAVDAWTYWKHRALHTRWLFGFHRDHHTFRDPSAFAGFAVGPVEALWTFAPVLIVLHPQAIHWGPVYVALVVGFVCLNLYLHCGVTVRWIEATLPRIGINTSAHHNVHHSHVRVHFGEVATWWDHLCRTRLADGSRAAPASVRTG